MSAPRRPALLLVLLLAQAAAAQTARWEVVAQKIRAAQDYAFHYTFHGNQGRFDFAYAADRAGRIRTEILPDSDRGAGTIIVFDPGTPDVVTMTTPLGRLRRSISSRDIKGTSLYTSLYGQLLDKVAGAKFSLQGGTLFDFGSQRILVNAQNDIVRYQLLTGDRVTEEMDFRDINWNSKPKLDF